MVGLADKPSEESKSFFETLLLTSSHVATWAWANPTAAVGVVLVVALGVYAASRNWPKGAPDMPPVVGANPVTDVVEIVSVNPDMPPAVEIVAVNPATQAPFHESLREALPHGEYLRITKKLRDIFQEEDSVDSLIEYFREGVKLEGMTLEDKCLQILVEHYRVSRGLTHEELEDAISGNDVLAEQLALLSTDCARIFSWLIDHGFLLVF